MQQDLVSVIIPFYNAKEFITQAVLSALDQPETGEVLLIEDGSPDGGLDVCTKLAQKYSQVRLFQHPDFRNHGMPASRNLGVINSHCPYIAFLDADDYYLPGRFTKTFTIFKSDRSIEGVYNALGVHFETEVDRETFARTSLPALTTVKETVSPEELFRRLISLGKGIGGFHFNTLTVKRTLFNKTGLFTEDLLVHADTEMMYKMASVGKLVPGEINNPVSIRRVHNNNRITHHLANKRKTYSTETKMFKSLLEWSQKNLSKNYQNLITLRSIERFRKSDYFDDHNCKDFLNSRKSMLRLAIAYPNTFLNHWFWRLIIPSKSLFMKKGKA